MTQTTPGTDILAAVEEHLYNEFKITKEVTANPSMLNYSIRDHKLYAMVENGKLTLLSGPIGKSLMAFGRSTTADLSDPNVWDIADEWLRGEVVRMGKT